MINFSAEPVLGREIKPHRFLINIPYENVIHTGYTYGPVDLGDNNSTTNISLGNHKYPWACYVYSDGSTCMRRILDDGLLSDTEIDLLTLAAGITKVSFCFDENGNALVGYLNSSNTLGYWWKNPSTGLNNLVSLGITAQDVWVCPEYIYDPSSDVILLYFYGGALYYRRRSENFSTEYSTTVTGLTDPKILWAGTNHRFAFQVDYKDYA